MIASLLACAAAPVPPAPAPVPAPPAAPTADRWAEVVALAAPEACSPAPQALADALARDNRDPEEIRIQLGAWHAAQPEVLVKFADPGPVAGTTGVLAWSDWIHDDELPAWTHLLASLARCGGLEEASVAAIQADRLCRKRGTAFAREASVALKLPPAPVLAAREAVAQIAAVESLSAGGGRSAEQVEDLQRYLEAWILDQGAGSLPPVERRPLVAITRAAMDPPWSLLLAKRASAEACIAPALAR